MNSLASVAHARRAVLAMARPVGAEPVALGDAVGRTLAGPVASAGPLPPFDTSAMDGYAVRLADLAEVPATLPLAGAVHAGDGAPGALAAGTTQAIMTGAVLPAGTQAVVPIEWTHRDGDAVRIERAPTPGQFLRLRGSALAAGATVLDAGTVVTPGAVGLLAAIGAAAFEVHNRPRVAVIATGDELVDAAASPGPGQIRDANGPGLAAQVGAAGGSVVGPLIARDTLADLAGALDAAADADVIVLAGGVSMGERDHVRAAVSSRGGTWAVWGVAQRPGKPLAVGTLGGRPVVGLPGNPVSAAVCFEVYVRPLLAAMVGRPSQPVTEAAVLAEAMPKAAGLHTFARVTAARGADGVLRLRSAAAQGSHVALSLAVSDGVAHLPAEWADAPAGAGVSFQRWGWAATAGA